MSKTHRLDLHVNILTQAIMIYRKHDKFITIKQLKNVSATLKEKLKERKNSGKVFEKSN